MNPVPILNLDNIVSNRSVEPNKTTRFPLNHFQNDSLSTIKSHKIEEKQIKADKLISKTNYIIFTPQPFK
jgi:hypothetical protein